MSARSHESCETHTRAVPSDRRTDSAVDSLPHRKRSVAGFVQCVPGFEAGQAVCLYQVWSGAGRDKRCKSGSGGRYGLEAAITPARIDEDVVVPDAVHDGTAVHGHVVDARPLTKNFDGSDLRKQLDCAGDDIL